MSESIERFTREFLSRVDFRTMPIYVALSALTAWLGLLSIWIFSLEGVTPADVSGFSSAVVFLVVLFALMPILQPVCEAVIALVIDR